MLFGLFGGGEEEEPKEEMVVVYRALLITSKGNMGAELFKDDAPHTVEHFLRLVKEGFYKNMIFHRLIPNVLIQTGCPNGDGTGNAGFHVHCEISGAELDKGSILMAHCGRDTNSSQFFICLDRSTAERFQNNHTYLGQIDQNIDILDDLEYGDKLLDIKVSKQMVKKQDVEDEED